ncbi:MULTISPECIES: hypothetical protein [unclassified Microbacterium]|uniref:hypothetical protein n=1 Tax=unclassified Microbacterium TaxID=2609290 RepID=UPI000EAA5C2F|nr:MULTISPECIES: hypothetical protein [unclassified Microbacterium]MBT2483177.1 hypothetical protein [Microbacterium sp. ISL-108]RKN66231.1 hypothetical protein D7252_00510 [Microbacterium sp. CGR2]
MKHVTFGEKAHFLGDDAADTLVEYAKALGNADHSDTVTLAAVDDHGNSVEATFLLNPSSAMLVETSSSNMAEPDNDAAIEDMRARMARLTDPPEIVAEHESPSPDDAGHHSTMG